MRAKARSSMSSPKSSPSSRAMPADTTPATPSSSDLNKGKTAVIVGAQWGDEGKGKIVDVLSEEFSIVARYAGGHNAGHTVIIRSEQGQNRGHRRRPMGR